MISTAQGKRVSLSRSQRESRRTDSLLWRKIWLPKLLYELLPYFYIAAGFAAFLATLYIGEWFWVLPHYLLFSIACVHLGIFVYRRRSRDAADDA